MRRNHKKLHRFLSCCAFQEKINPEDAQMTVEMASFTSKAFAAIFLKSERIEYAAASNHSDPRVGPT